MAVVLWRRKWIVIGTFLTLTLLTAIVSKSLPKQYEATATLWVTEGSGTATFDAVQAGQVLAGTYGKVADNQIIAQRVADSLPFETDGEEVLGAMTFGPVAETQLLRITATDGDPRHARAIANTYARVFIAYSRTQLGDAVNARIAFAAPASIPSQPSKPQPALYTVAGALLGLALGVGLALLAEMVDRRIGSPEELEDLAGAPVLAQVPRRTNDQESEVAFEESFRQLRTNLQFLNGDSEALRSLVVVSPSVGDGKSTVAYNLARSFAETGTRVILVEADMRRPSLRGAVRSKSDSDKGSSGLSGYLNRTADLDAVLCPTDLPSLQFVPSGILPPTPSTLVSVERARILLADALELADLVIVDTPPLSVGAESSALAASADGVLMAIDAKASGKPVIRRACQQLAVVKATLLGVVLNSVRTLPDVGAYGYWAGAGDTSRKRGTRPGKRRPQSRV